MTNITQRDVWDCILQNNRITPCWKYVIDYWDEYGHSDTLAQFVEDNILTILRSNSRKISNEFLYDFYNAYIIEFYKNNKIEYAFKNEVDFQKIDIDNLGYLVENNLIFPSMDNFELLSETDVDLFQKFALKYELEFRCYVESTLIEGKLYQLLIHNIDLPLETRFILLESKGGLYMDEEMAKSLMNNVHPFNVYPFRPLIYQYVIKALKNYEELQIKTMMQFLHHLDKSFLLHSFRWIDRYKKIYHSQDELIVINKSKRNEEPVKYMKSINMLENYFTTSKQIEFNLLNE